MPKLQAIKQLLSAAGQGSKKELRDAAILLGLGGTAGVAGAGLGAGAVGGGLLGLLDSDTYSGRIAGHGKEMVVDEDTGVERGPLDNFYDSIGAHMTGGAAAVPGALGGGITSSLLGALLAKRFKIKAPISKVTATGLLGAGAGGYGGYQAGHTFARDYETQPNPDDPRNKSASMSKQSNKFMGLLGRLGITKTDSLLRQGTKGLADATLIGPAAGLGGLAGLGVGMANAPEGETLKGGLATGAGVMAAILGGVGGRRWLQHLASKKGLNLNLNSNMQRMVGYGGGGTAAGMGTSKGVQELGDLIGV